MALRALGAELGGWVFGGAASGAVVGALAVRANTSLQGSGQAWPFIAWAACGYAAGTLTIGVAGLAIATRAARGASNVARWRAASAGALAVLPSFAGAQFAIATVNWRGPTNTQNVVAALGVAMLVAWLVRIAAARMKPTGGRRASNFAATLVALASAGVAAWGAAAEPARTVGEPPAVERTASAPNPRVMLIGIDGLDWARLTPLIDSGRCPNFARLVAESFHAPLSTIEPTWSPIVWNTISTGEDMDVHGILDFTELELPGLERGAQRLYPKGTAPAILPAYSGLPALFDLLAERGVLVESAISGLHRRAPALWNVLSNAGIDVGVVRWWASWPAEQARGFIVSDNDPLSHALSKSKMSVKDGAIALANMTHPAELARELIPLIEPPPGDARASDEVAEALLRDPILRDLTPGDVAELRNDPGNLRWFDIIRRGDAFSTRAALHLWREKHVSMCAVYLRAVDNLSHRLWKHAGVVDRAYEFTDARLGELLDVAGPEAIVLLVSDHGWCYEPGPQFGHGHAPPGVLMLRGPHVVVGRIKDGVEPPSVFDVAPTVLALYGLPANSSQRGRPLTSAFDAAAPIHSAPPAVTTWGAYQPRWSRSAALADEHGRREAADLLRHLGYLD